MKWKGKVELTLDSVFSLSCTKYSISNAFGRNTTRLIRYVIHCQRPSNSRAIEWRKAQQGEAESQAPKRARVEIVETLINQSSEEAARIVREMSVYKETERERPGYKALRQQRDQNDDRYSKLTIARDRLVVELQVASRFTDESLACAIQFRADIIGGLEQPTFEDKRRYLKLLHVQA